jgi:hypothetical protein
VGRYVLGLDPLTAAGGPTGPPPQHDSKKTPDSKSANAAPKPDVTRTLSIVPLTQGAMTDSVMVEMTSQGTENSLQFGLTFDPTALSYVNYTIGSGAAASGAHLIVNSNNAPAGQLGVVLGLMPPQTFMAGTLPLVKLTFNSISYSNTTSLAFADVPIVRQLVDANVNTLSASYQGRSFPIAGVSWPQLTISQAPGNVILSWPYSPTVVAAQWSTNMGTNWSDTGGTPVINGGIETLTLPVPTKATIYRLHTP